MADAIEEAQAYGKSYQFQDADKAASDFVDVAFRLTDIVKQRMEGEDHGAKWKAPHVGEEDVKQYQRDLNKKRATSAVKDAIKDLAKGIYIVANLFAKLVSGQFLAEGNNRFTYLVLCILGGHYKFQPPAPGPLSVRDKDQGQFDTDKLEAQYVAAYQ